MWAQDRRISPRPGGVGPASVRFQQAPNVSGSPGTYINIGSAITGIASGAPSNFTATGLIPRGLLPMDCR
jgi:hypothetical protein